MIKWISKSEPNPSNAIQLSKLKKEDILLLQYNNDMDILYDFNNLGFFKIRRLKKDVYPIIKNSTDPKLELLARTIYSLTKLKIKHVEAYFNKDLLFCKKYEYVGTIEKIYLDTKTSILINIYPYSDQCLPCYRIAGEAGIIPLRKMNLIEFNNLLKQCQSIQEFKQHFNFFLTYPHDFDKDMLMMTPYRSNVVDEILNGIQGLTLIQVKKYIEDSNLDYEEIKAKIEFELFKRLKNNINQNKWGALFDKKLLVDHRVDGASELIGNPNEIKKILEKICLMKGGIIV
jgi:hypothetical protein